MISSVRILVTILGQILITLVIEKSNVSSTCHLYKYKVFLGVQIVGGRMRLEK
jgi:hypothetical protein